MNRLCMVEGHLRYQDELNFQLEFPLLPAKERINYSKSDFQSRISSKSLIDENLLIDSNVANVELSVSNLSVIDGAKERVNKFRKTSRHLSYVQNPISLTDNSADPSSFWSLYAAVNFRLKTELCCDQDSYVFSFSRSYKLDPVAILERISSDLKNSIVLNYSAIHASQLDYQSQIIDLSELQHWSSVISAHLSKIVQAELICFQVSFVTPEEVDNIITLFDSIKAINNNAYLALLVHEEISCDSAKLLANKFDFSVFKSMSWDHLAFEVPTAIVKLSLQQRFLRFYEDTILETLTSPDSSYIHTISEENQLLPSIDELKEQEEILNDNDGLTIEESTLEDFKDKLAMFIVFLE